jgi:hypothetical protein
VANPSKRKGDWSELEIAKILAALTGWPVRRKLGAGRMDDTGDLDGIPDTVAQVKNRPADVLRAVRETLDELPTQQANAGATFGVGFIRRPGGRWFAIQTLEQWATYARETTDGGPAAVTDPTWTIADPSAAGYHRITDGTFHMLAPTSIAQAMCDRLNALPAALDVIARLLNCWDGDTETQSWEEVVFPHLGGHPERTVEPMSDAERAVLDLVKDRQP